MADHPLAPKTLTPEFIAALGKESDTSISQRSGVHRFRVFEERARRGIPAFSPIEAGRTKLNAFKALLGKRPDREVARVANVNVTLVATVRREAGIAALEEPGHGVKVPKHVLKLLSTTTIPELSREFDIPLHVLINERKRRGIKFNRATAQPLKPSQVKRLGMCPDAELSAEWQLSRHVIAMERQRRGIHAYTRRPLHALPAKSSLSRLKARSDRIVATTLNVTRETAMLARHRVALGENVTNTQRVLPDRAIPLLGKISDRILAARFNVSARTIYRARVARGIPKASRSARAARE